jgi:hypothetical protein
MHGAASRLNTAQNGSMIHGYLIGKDLDVSGLGIIKVLYQHLREGTEKYREKRP